jgi:hypothetical protein
MTQIEQKNADFFNINTNIDAIFNIFKKLVKEKIKEKV